jgi:chemotaxis protein MotB
MYMASARTVRPRVPPRPPVTGTLRQTADWLLEDLEEPEASVENGWVVSYLDVLLLLITLFAVLLGLSYLREGTAPRAAPAVDAGLLGLPLELAVQATAPPPAPLDAGAMVAAVQTLAREPAPALEAAPAAVAAEPSLPAAPAAGDSGPAATALPADALAGLSFDLELLPQPRVDLEAVLQRVADRDRERLELVANPQEIRLEVRDDILFPLGSAELGAAGQALLARLAESLAGQDLRISVEGHTDDLAIATARFPSNWELSGFRATTVARELIAHGVPQERVRIIGFADTRPRVPNDSAANRARNRRVSLVLHRPGSATPDPARFPATRPGPVKM